jgi:two-component system LytT family response regulator
VQESLDKRPGSDARAVPSVTASTRPLSVLVVDDEVRARRNLQHLALTEPDVADCVLCDNGAEAVGLIRERRPDLVFLDVQMPEVDGFEVVRRVGIREMPALVFVTAFDAWAVRAFEVNAVDYLLKPVSDERFAAAMARVRARHVTTEAWALAQRLTSLLGQAASSAPAPTASSTPRATLGVDAQRRLVIRDGASSILLDPGEIEWISADDYCIDIHAGQRSHVVRMTLTAFAERLDPARFVRVHRSAVVNVDRVKSVGAGVSGRVVLTLESGQTVPVSRSRVPALRALLGDPR